MVNSGIYACDTTLTRSRCSGPPSALVCRFFGVLRPPERALEPASPRVQSPADYLQKKPPEWWLFFSKWSEWRDLNPRPLAPQTSALPDCATFRCRLSRISGTLHYLASICKYFLYLYEKMLYFFEM